MKKITNNSRVCSSCRYYKAFYSKGACAFYREKNGYCELVNRPMSSKGYCDFYKYRRQEEKRVSLEMLDKVISEIEKMEQIFYNFGI